MRAIWKGTISFGLVSVPVRVFSATEEHDVPLHQVHDADGGRIRYQRRCEVCGEVVDYDHIDKAYDDGERTVVLTRDELGSLPSERSREIEVLSFVPSEQIDPILLDRTYFLEADPASRKPYALLLKALESTDRTAVARFALRQRTRLAALRARGDMLTVQTLLWPDEVRDPGELEGRKGARVSAKELEMAKSLVESYAEDFAPDAVSDDYQVELRKLVEAKLAKGETLDTAETFGETEEGESADVVPLMEALRRSVEAARSKRKKAS